MKILFSILLYAAVSTAAFAKEIVIGLSPYQAPEILQQQVKQSLKYATTLKGGDTVSVIDAYHIKPLAKFTVPEGKAYRSPKARIKANKKAVAVLMQFAKKPPQSDPAPSVTGALRMPQFLRHVTQNFSGDKKVDVLVFGSPLYDDPADSQFSMVGALVPNDGHLQVSRNQSVYGIKGYDQALKNIRVHWAYGDKAIFPSDQHSFMIERFWQLFVAEQGGDFITFAPFTKTAFERVKKSSSALSNPHNLEKTERLEMIRLKAIEVEQSIHERPLSTLKPSAQQVRAAQNIEIGITWDCARCDIDLYVRPLPSSAVLYYGHTRSDVGVYFKDYTKAPISSGGFETIELSVPVDLRSLVIATNFYGGESAQGVTGEIRLALEGQTYGLPFTLQATKGNGGAQVREAIAQGKSLSKHTILIDPLAIIPR